MSSTILITGGNGFLARSFLEAFNRDYIVNSLSREKLDLMDSGKVFNYLKKKQFDVVIHAATYDAAPIDSLKDPSLVLENNLKMFFNLERCNNYYGKLLYFGSGAEFSRPHWKSNMNENYFDHYVPKDQYGFSKYIMTKYSMVSDNIFNLRLFGVHGKYDDWRYRFISNACCHVAFDMPISIVQNAVFDFLYIDDLVKIVQWFINNEPKQNIYNVCSGKTYDYITLANKIIEISTKDLEVIVKREGCRAEYSGDHSLLLAELNNFEFTHMNESLKEVYRWYDSNKNLIDPDKFHY